jgi:hypothetical protein
VGKNHLLHLILNNKNMYDELIAEKRAALREARRRSNKAALHGRHNWGDFHRNQHIKELEREIQILREQKAKQSLTTVERGEHEDP